MPRATGSVFFYLATVSFAVGIFARSFIAFNLSTICWFVLIALVLAVEGRRETPPRLLLSSLLVFCFALGALRLEVASWSSTDVTLEAADGQEVELVGVVKREPEARAYSTHLYVETDYGLVLAFADPGRSWQYGDSVVVRGDLAKPEAFETDLGRTFNYPGYLLAKGVSYTVRDALVTDKGGQGGVTALSALYRIKHSFIQILQQLIPEPQVALGQGLLLGVKEALGDDLETAFRRSGVIHIVVLSGYNVMLVVVFTLFILNSLLGKRLGTLFGLVSVALFALLVGLGATVIRASIMAALLLLMGLTGRVYLVLRGLCVAGVLMLLWNPYALAFDVGFQLSFVATLGLILVSPQVERGVQWFPNFFGTREFLAATIATQLFVLPILLYQIGELSVVSVVVNVLVLPMVPIAMLLTFITGLVGAVSLGLAEPIAYLAHLSLSYIIMVAEFFSTWSLAAFTVPPFPFWVVPVGYGLISFWLWRLTKEPDELKDWVIVEDN